MCHSRFVVKKTVQLYPDDPQGCTGIACIGWRSLSMSVMGAGTDLSTVVLPPGTEGFGDDKAPVPLFLTHPPARLFNNGQRQPTQTFVSHPRTLFLLPLLHCHTQRERERERERERYTEEQAIAPLPFALVQSFLPDAHSLHSLGYPHLPFRTVAGILGLCNRSRCK